MSSESQERERKRRIREKIRKLKNERKNKIDDINSEIRNLESQL